MHTVSATKAGWYESRFRPLRSFVPNPSKGSFPPILWKNNVLQVQNVVRQTQHERLSCHALRNCCGAGKSWLVCGGLPRTEADNIRETILVLECKDRWTDADRARLSELHQDLRAA